MRNKIETICEDKQINTEKAEKKGIKSFEKNTENPFMVETLQAIEVRNKTQIMRSGRDTLHHVVNSDGEITAHSTFVRHIEVDEERFTKLYLSNFAAFFELPSCAMKVFLYIMTKLLNKEDKVEFILNDCMIYTKYTSVQPIYTGLVALCENKIIARGYNEYVYFINPLVFFNGNRVTFAKTYIKKRGENPKQYNLFSKEKKEITETI